MYKRKTTPGGAILRGLLIYSWTLWLSSPPEISPSTRLESFFSHYKVISLSIPYSRPVYMSYSS